MFASSESLLENVHGGVHFWKSYRHCCLQLFRNKFHCNCVSEFPHLVKQSKWNKLPLPLGRSQENVHDVVHFWNSYRYCCSQLFKKELHFSQLEGLLQKLWNKINKKVVSAFSTFQRKCLYKEVHFCSSHFKGVSQKLWNKANKKAFSAFRTFPKNVYDEVYFWKNYRLLLPTLTQINSIIAIFREFCKSFETIENISFLWIESDEIISGKITGGCFVFSLK